MKSWGLLGSAIAGAALFASSVAADASTIDPLVIKGKHFFYKTNGTEFFIRGVAYQQDYNANGTSASNADYTDPLADITACQRDIPYLVQLRTNLIRTYAVNPDTNHDECMNALAAAGIYVISDLSDPTNSINRNDPSWTDSLYKRYTGLVDNMSKYNNVVGFFAGNEVSNSYNTTAASAFVKAAVRDTKNYIKQRGYRQMYVGYATYDGPIRDQLAEYFNCGDQSEAIDFWGYNVYSWCGNSNYQESGYDERTDFFRDYSVPAFFAEYGCNNIQPRRFTEVATLFGPLMSGVWAGGIVYMYFQETNNYGLVQVSGNSVSKLPDFNYLSSAMAKVSPASTAMSAYATGDLTAMACPTQDASWSAKATPLPPAPNGDLCACMMSNAQCVIKSSVPDTAYGDIFNYICSKDPSACAGIANNATTGNYGAYSGCDSQEQLSYVMNKYYENLGSSNNACQFKGQASLKAAATGDSSCGNLLQAAGANGQGTAVPSPTAVASAQGGGSTGAASSNMIMPGADFAILQMVLYVSVAVASGAGMILL